jgi:hypothetical protein
MQPYQINLINGVVLVAMGLWGYLSGGDNASPTALIPVVFGIIFLAVTPPFRRENKVVAHIVVLLTLLIVLSLFMPLKARITAEDTIGIARVGVMILTSAIAMVIYIRSFIAARKARTT